MDLEVNDNTSKPSESSICKKLKQNEDDLTGDVGSSAKVAESDLLNHDDDDDDDINNDDGDADCDNDFDYGDDDDYMYDNGDDDDNGNDNDNDDCDDYAKKMQSLYDNVDLPSGVEVSLPWLKDPAPTDAESKVNVAASSSSTVPVEKSKEVDVMGRFDLFKSFDIVQQFADHHYARAGSLGEQAPANKNWAKRIQEEWQILENNLPDKFIYVRVSEARMDLLRAVIVGPDGTPYHDGLFTFDAIFPPEYPNVPPMVYYYSGGLRLNPNLYDCGKVCLSLLGTWSGSQNEQWIPGKSTMLQVLVSIQALILNAEPMYNEPGFTKMTGSDVDRRSNKYNENAYILSLKTMLYTIRRPPKYFEELVAGHFRVRANDILMAAKSYMEGAQVGSFVKGGDQEAKRKAKNDPAFKNQVGKMINVLVDLFVKNGSKDCEQFRLPEGQIPNCNVPTFNDAMMGSE